MTTFGEQLDEWALSFPTRLSRLWDELLDAYAWFCEPRIDAAEVRRRWLLVVHLAHNFKSQVQVREPMSQWAGVVPDVLRIPPAPPSSLPAPPDELRRAIVAGVGRDYCTVGGIAVPIASAICAVVDPGGHAIVDRWAFMAAIAVCGGDSPTGVPAPLGDQFSDSSMTPVPTPLRWTDYTAYLQALHRIRDQHAVTMQTAERGLFRIGRTVGVANRPRTWGAYRAVLDGRFWTGPE